MGLRLAVLKGGLALIAKVAVSAAVFAIDKPYDYQIPDGMVLCPGMRVKIPFGRGNRICEGILLQIVADVPAPGLKEILAPLDDTPVLSEQMLHLAAFVRQRYFCTFYEAVHAMLPAGIWFRAEERFQISSQLPQDWAAILMHKPDAIALIKFMQQQGGCVTQPVLEKKFPEMISLQKTLRSLIDLDYIQRETNLIRKSKEKTERLITLHVAPGDARILAKQKKKTAPLQSAVLDFLACCGSALSKDLTYFTGASLAVMRRLESLGLVTITQQPMQLAMPFCVAEPTALPELNAAQRTAFQSLCSDFHAAEARTALLYGVTGAGKTAVYLQLIQHCLNCAHSALVLVPEIALTPQLLQRFSACFGSKVALLHSGLRTSERYDQWRRIKDGEAQVVLGTRSAIFAPLKQLGLIILDEEQEHTYKSENTPRYHAREVAQYRAIQAQCLVVLGSATPSVATMYLAETGRYRQYRLPERYCGTALPQVKLVDMKQELRAGNGGVISRLLRQELQDNLERGEQSILFLNRRGNSKMVLCVDCGFVPQCPNCSVHLTYHSANGRLMCHYCGYSTPLPPICPSCAGHLKQIGFGTQRLEQEIHSIWPDIALLRMDADTVSAVNTHEKVFQRFSEEKIPILIGTQMVAKGLDFPDVTLVGVMDADQSLYMPSYRAAEDTFSIVTQAIGRAGRGKRPGRAIIQTMTPASTVLQLAAAQDYDAFYQNEIQMRQLQHCPPFGDLIIFQFSGIFQERVLAAAAEFRQLFVRQLKQWAGEAPLLLGPVPAAIAKVNNRYRYRLTLHCANSRTLRRLITQQLQWFAKKREFSSVHISADCNPFDS